MTLLVVGGKDYRYGMDNARDLRKIVRDFGAKKILCVKSPEHTVYGRAWAKVNDVPFEEIKMNMADYESIHKDIAKNCDGAVLMPGTPKGKNLRFALRSRHVPILVDRVEDER